MRRGRGAVEFGWLLVRSQLFWLHQRGQRNHRLIDSRSRVLYSNLMIYIGCLEDEVEKRSTYTATKVLNLWSVGPKPESGLSARRLTGQVTGVVVGPNNDGSSRRGSAAS